MFWDKRRVHDILKRHVYIGKLAWSGLLYDGAHQPIITESKFNQVQNIFNERNCISPRNKITGLLKGFLFCGICNNKLSPNYTKKKNGAKYYYYRCVSTLNNKKSCTGQYLPLKAVNDEVINKILSYSTEQEITNINLKVKEHNKSINKNICFVQTELENLELKLNEAKSKKEKYLDTLISGNFTINERKKINNVIDEYSLAEKQIQTGIHKKQFELSELKDSLKEIEPFKEAITYFKINYSAMTEQELISWLSENIRGIFYKSGQIKITFTLLDFGS